jgi:hypothetical protein
MLFLNNSNHQLREEGRSQLCTEKGRADLELSQHRFLLLR